MPPHAPPAPAWAQGYPSKPVTIVVAYPAGGDTDALARLFAEKLSTRIGQPVVVDNRPGASGVIGSSYVAKAPADGYTLLLAPSTFSIAQLVLKTGGASSYDVLNGFTPIIQTGTLPLFLVAGSGAGIKSFKDADRPPPRPSRCPMPAPAAARRCTSSARWSTRRRA